MNENTIEKKHAATTNSCGYDDGEDFVDDEISSPSSTISSIKTKPTTSTQNHQDQDDEGLFDAVNAKDEMRQEQEEGNENVGNDDIEQQQQQEIKQLSKQQLILRQMPSSSSSEEPLLSSTAASSTLLSPPVRTTDVRHQVATISGDVEQGQLHYEQQQDDAQQQRGEQEPRTTRSYIRSLPEVEALPEDSKTSSVVAEVTEVIPIPFSPCKTTKRSIETNLGSSNNDDVHDVEAQTPPPLHNTLDVNGLKSTAKTADNIMYNNIMERRPALMSVSVFKVTRENKLGIALETVNGKLKVLRINTTDPNCLLSKSQINVGDNVLSINNQYCARWSPTRAIQLLKDLIGLVSIMVSDDHGDKGLARAVVVKMNTTDRVGIAFTQEHGRLRITAIHRNGLLGGGGSNNETDIDEGGKARSRDSDGRPGQSHGSSALNVGDYMVSINGIDCLELNPSTAKDLILNSPNNVVTLVATTTDSTVALSTRDVVWGLESGKFNFEDDEEHEHPSTATEVANIDDDVPIIAEATQISGELFDVTNNLHDDPSNHSNQIGHNGILPAYISIMVVKPTVDTPLGIKLVTTSSATIDTSENSDSSNNSNDKVLTIGGVAPGSILSSTPIQAGFILLSINNKPCRTGSRSKAAQYIRESHGELNLVVQNPNGDPNYTQAMVMKLDFPQAKVGIGFQGYTFGTHYLKVSSINPNGLFAHSVLNVGDKVLSINSQCCRHYQPSDAVNLIRQLKESISIVVETSHSSGIVVSDVGNLRASLKDQNKRNSNESHLRLLDGTIEDRTRILVGARQPSDGIINEQGGQTSALHLSHQVDEQQDQSVDVENQRPRRANWSAELERQERESKQALNVFVCFFVAVLLGIVIITIPEFKET